MTRLRAACAALLLVGAAGCSGGTSGPGDQDSDARSGSLGAAIPAAQADIRGMVTAVDGASIRVESNPAERSGSPKASVRLTSATKVLHRDGAPAGARDLAPGRDVSVWFTGPVMESYPVQATGAVIVLEQAGIP